MLPPLFFFTGKSHTPSMEEPKEDTIAIISLNDFHGAFVTNMNQRIPGAGNLYSVIKQIKDRYPYHIVISVGDNFGGSYFSNLTEGSLIPYFFRKLGIDVSALGNHEFDNGQEFLKNKWGNVVPKDTASGSADTLTYVCANLNNSEGHIPGYAVPWVVKELKMPNNATKKLAIIGLIASSAKEQIKQENSESLAFRSDYGNIVDSLQQYTPLKNIPWQILAAHIGTKMQNDTALWDDSYSRNLKPLRIISGIASGHSHERVAGFINNTPVVQGMNYGKCIGVLRYTYNSAKNDLHPIAPIVINADSVKDSSADRIEIDGKVDSIFHHFTEPSVGMKLSATITQVISKDGLPHNRKEAPSKQDRLTALGTYVCMSYANAYRQRLNLSLNDVVLAFSHRKGIRTSLPYGDINVLTAAEVLPFASHLKVYNMTGKEIFALMEAGLSNSQGCLQANNIVIDTIYVAGRTRVVNIRYNVPGREEIFLDKKERYPVVVDEFITTGGDGYSPNLFPADHSDSIIKDSTTTASFLRYLRINPALDNNTSFKAKLKHYLQ